MEKIYTMINGKRVELPQYTMKVIDLIDRVINAERELRKGNTSARECMTAEYQFLIDLLGEEKVSEVFGPNLEEMDMTIMIGGVYVIIQRYTLEAEQAKGSVDRYKRPTKKYKRR